MTVAEKLEVIDLVWNDLVNNSENVPSPEWHQQVLNVREEDIKSGKDKFTDWDAVKKEILNLSHEDQNSGLRPEGSNKWFIGFKKSKSQVLALTFLNL
jgi:hypothetical protein